MKLDKMMILEEIGQSDNKLYNAVMDSIIDHSYDYLTEGETEPTTRAAATYLDDVLYGGCQSGIVSELIYYSDTVAFFEKYIDEIAAIVRELIGGGCLSSLADLKGWDEHDPLIRDTLNKNLLAWLAYEEVAREIYSVLEEE